MLPARRLLAARRVVEEVAAFLGRAEHEGRGEEDRRLDRALRQGRVVAVAQHQGLGLQDVVADAGLGGARRGHGVSPVTGGGDTGYAANALFRFRNSAAGRGPVVDRGEMCEPAEVGGRSRQRCPGTARPPRRRHDTGRLRNPSWPSRGSWAVRPGAMAGAGNRLPLHKARKKGRTPIGSNLSQIDSALSALERRCSSRASPPIA